MRRYTNNVQPVDASNFKNNLSNKFYEAIDNNNHPTSIPTYLPFFMSLRVNKNHSELPDSTHSTLMSLTIKSVPVVSAYQGIQNFILIIGTNLYLIFIIIR